MSKILLLNSGLHSAQTFMEPFIKRLEVYLLSQPECECVDIRTAETFHEKTFFEYDKVVFVFSIAMNSIPSSTLEVFQKLESQHKKKAKIYAVIACDEYEPEKCNYSERILQSWCAREELSFQGSLKIGSVLCIMKSASRFIVSDRIKDFASAMLHEKKVNLKVTLLSDGIFMKKANKYWEKEIKKIHKEIEKNSSC